MSKFNENSEMQKFWNEEGGEKWVENIDAVEAMILPMSNSLLEQTAAQSGEYVLDVGCGGGITSIKLAAQVGDTGKVLGVDVSEPIISIATDRGEGIANLEFQLGDVTSADLGEDRFDLITSRFGVMFFDDPVAAFSNMRRALKPTGRLVFICWQALERNPWMGEPAAATFEILPPPADAAPRDPTAPGPFSLGDAEHLQKILQAAGYSQIDPLSVDIPISLGSLDNALKLMTKLGPTAEALQTATEEEKATVIVAVRKVLEKYDSGNGVSAPAATWIVKASK